MDMRYTMLIIKGEIKTSEIKFCNYNEETQKWDIKFNNEKVYSYAPSSVECLENPQTLSSDLYRISHHGKIFTGMEVIYVFHGKEEEYWRIGFEKGMVREYKKSDLEIVESCLSQKKSQNVFTYIKEIAGLSDIKSKRTGEKLLAKKFKKISSIGEDTALAKYLDPSKLKKDGRKEEYVPIFPFGCNNSQYKAVKAAMENQISVIQGPPGTGKTQTILNIISNILMDGKSVQVVSNNNSAIENVYDKLASPKYDLGFIVALLGNSENKKRFIENQDTNYPDFSLWKSVEDSETLRSAVADKSAKLKDIFDRQEILASLRREYSRLLTELEFFHQYIKDHGIKVERAKFRKNISSSQWLGLWQECQTISEEKQVISVWFKIKSFLRYGIGLRNFYKNTIEDIITTFQAMFYYSRQRELTEEIDSIEEYLKTVDHGLTESLCEQSMTLLKNSLAQKYTRNDQRKLFGENDLWKNPEKILDEYPVILSTTFSSRDSLKDNIIYDYLIMDEASQVDIATGALALSCARNVVIVGDTKQLPNVVTEDIRARAQMIFDKFDLNAGYQYTKSFLQSLLDVMPEVAQTMLREHYRCHPKIIEFCNQKFYEGKLVIMTEDHGEKDVLSVVKTVVGNHAREHYSQRQIDVIKSEIIPKYDLNPEDTGIVSPYKNQVNALNKEIQDVDAATVHKFQGREKDNIIISTVDDEISDFADDPYLLNVAVSRAKKRLMLVVTGNKQEKEHNITDLVDYIQYNNFEVTDSKIYSIFDYLYKQYGEQRKLYLQKHKRISEVASENLMYGLLEDIIKQEKLTDLDIACHVQLRTLIKNTDLLNEQERCFAMRAGTHLDFLLYRKISKKPVLAIEVDGYDYHKENTEQSARDAMKDHILELYGIPHLRLKTNGSQEKEKIIEILSQEGHK